MVRDLRSWLDTVNELGLLREIRGADWDLEIGCITDMNAKHKKYTLLFDEIRGYPRGFRVLTGALLDSARVALSLGLPPTLKDMELVKAIKERLSIASTSAKDFEPRYVKSAPVFENTMEGDSVDVYKFPTPRWMAYDGGRYIGTADAVITRDPDEGWVNVGTYRIMIQSKNTATILIEAPRHARPMIDKYWKRNEPCPIAVSLGHHPLIQIFGGMEVPPRMSEYTYAGVMSGEPYEVVKGPVTGLPIPADSEIVIEGYVLPETKPEGPFAEFVGYYAGGVTQSPLIKIEAVHYRDDPIISGTIAGKPPHDYTYFRCPMRAALIWDILEKAGIPGVVGVWCHEAGYSRAFTVVSIKQMYAGQNKLAGYVAAQCRPGAVTGRYVVVVDDDIDPTNLNEVVWAMCSRSDPATGIDVIRDTIGSIIDPLADHSPDKDILEYTGSRGLIFATKPFSKMLRGEFPRVAEPDPETKKKVSEKWRHLFT
ncbi:MAG: UbiD family decarboxylase [Aigarchaeota archaeon]|nr:UbiD family decarboxylase [Aigarchaeota archaeon]MDW8092225.1 UbiD family decarboxylase [Nitrososphaerota archaeon]